MSREAAPTKPQVILPLQAFPAVPLRSQFLYALRTVHRTCMLRQLSLQN